MPKNDFVVPFELKLSSIFFVFGLTRIGLLLFAWDSIYPFLKEDFMNSALSDFLKFRILNKP